MARFGLEQRQDRRGNIHAAYATPTYYPREYPERIPQGILRVGRRTTAGNGRTACTSTTGTIADCDAAINALGLTQRATYQPANRYLRFQLTETALYAALAIMIAALGARRIRRIDLT
ncbi:hypothetical protein [Actinoplanes sp. NPDC051411]|uniref:hypothetical protein n=1 Tax=Actinoplanes sp. NPDC051411 TaxID=3155522 RepID=UPI00344A60E2